MKQIISILFFLIVAGVFKLYCQSIEIIELNKNLKTENLKQDTLLKSIELFGIKEDEPKKSEYNNYEIKQTLNTKQKTQNIENKTLNNKHKTSNIKQNTGKGLEDEK